jgi:hypothetical protein
MAYDLKNVFYLGFFHEWANGAWTGAATSSTVANSGNGSLLIETLSPSKEVPYVVVRDTIFAIMSSTTAIGADIVTSYRIECAKITLDTATLNQLLRTQTA